MQVTIDLPNLLAEQLESEMDKLPEIIEQGMRKIHRPTSSTWREVISFLARGPRPEEIVAFRPSESRSARSRALLEKNSAGNLTPDENAEFDEIGQLNYLMMLLKAEARRILGTPRQP
jgi:hypothetical protein